MSTNYQMYKTWVDIIQTDGVNMTKWETDFVESINEQLEKNKHREIPLSEKQVEILERIYADRTA